MTEDNVRYHEPDSARRCSAPGCKGTPIIQKTVTLPTGKIRRFYFCSEDDPR